MNKRVKEKCVVIMVNCKLCERDHLFTFTNAVDVDIAIAIFFITVQSLLCDPQQQ